MAGTEPDLDLIKEVEQVTRLVLEGPARPFAWIPSVGITDAVAITELAVIWLQKQPGMAEGSRLPIVRNIGVDAWIKSAHDD